MCIEILLNMDISVQRQNAIKNIRCANLSKCISIYICAKIGACIYACIYTDLCSSNTLMSNSQKCGDEREPFQLMSRQCALVISPSLESLLNTKQNVSECNWLSVLNYSLLFGSRPASHCRGLWQAKPVIYTDNDNTQFILLASQLRAFIK